MDYTLREVDPEVWQRVRVRSVNEKIPIRRLLIACLQYYAEHGLPREIRKLVETD